ncbi:MAG TPA: hypothetical protein VM557_06225 [Thermoanaerobaculia bacterium]|nr:hypothetical protein [Thermoanaerobaculia bacterium]
MRKAQGLYVSLFVLMVTTVQPNPSNELSGSNDWSLVEQIFETTRRLMEVLQAPIG